MGKTGKWIKNLLTGKKDKENTSNHHHHHVTLTTTNEHPTTPISVAPMTTKEKRRWSFRRSSAAPPPHKDSTSTTDIITTTTTPPPAKRELPETENDKKKHAMAPVAPAIQLTAAASDRAFALEEAAAVRIQSVFRGYLARKALNALKGLVKLQALVRGHLVRKQAASTVRCMQALISVQARARAQRLRMAEDVKPPNNPRQSVHRKFTQDNKFRHSYQDLEEDIKIVEMDHGDSKGRNSYSNQGQAAERTEHRFSTHNKVYTTQDNQHQISPAPSAVTDQSPKGSSGHFEDQYYFGTAQSSPQCYTAMSKPDPSKIPFSDAQSEYAAEPFYNDYPFYPSYMANTQSSRAKVRSHSAPKQRPETFERQPSRRRPSIEGRNVPRAVRMHRSSSHVGSTAQNYNYPWSIKLDRSNISLKESECGSNYSALTTQTNYRSVVGFDVQEHRY